MQRQKKPPRARGYRIRVSYPGRPPVDLPLLWRTEPPVHEWERIKQDSRVVRAVMYRSGRPFQQFCRG